MDTVTYWAAVASAGLVLGLAAVHVLRRRRRQRRDAAALAEKLERGPQVPRSLHPVIDPDVCIGSLSCLKSCPEGDILGVVDGAARLVHGDHCIGHGRCAAECPVGAIRLVFGSAERGVDLPEVDEWFESSRPGVHVVGELGGMGLIKNAVTQGLQVAERLAAVRSPCPPGAVDVAIVGAGPAGLAAALGLHARGLTYRLLEQGTVGGSIAHYPRHKVVMTEPVHLPLYGKLGRRLMSKEELLAAWCKVIARGKIRVEEGVKVEGVEGEDGRFQILTTAGRVAASKVILATGRRGTPRKLGAPGEDLAKVTYGLGEPEQYQGCRVLVVGGGDSALEAVIQLAEQSSAEVTLSYRGEALARCREANRAKLEFLVRTRRVRTILPSQVTRIEAERVSLDVGGRSVEFPNDFVIVNIGGELPVEFLGKVGVGMRRYFGEAPGAAATGAERLRAGLAREEAERKRQRRRGILYLALGLCIVGWLALHGWSYYVLPAPQRLRSPLHRVLRSAAPFGHGVGIAATAFMLSNFLYAVRKRSRRLTGLGHIRAWLDFHVFVGFMSPFVIAFHAAFQSKNLLATGTAAALGVVVLTGIVGRFVYGMIPASGGQALELADLLGSWERLRSRLDPLVARARNPARVQALLATVAAPAKGGSMLRVFAFLPLSALRMRLRLLRLRSSFSDRGVWAEVRDGYVRLDRMRFQITFYRGLRRFLSAWRVFHASLAGFLVAAIAAHIGVSLYLGYGLK